MENNKDIETPKFVKELVEKVKTSEKLENTINSSRLSHSFYNRSSNFSLDLSREEIIEAKLKVSLENKVQFEIDSKVKEKINPMVEERIETIVQEMLKEMIEERIEFEAKMNMVGMNKATIEKNGASIREEIRTTRGESIKEYLIKNKGEEIATLSNNISQSIRKEILKEKGPSIREDIQINFGESIKKYIIENYEVIERKLITEQMLLEDSFKDICKRPNEDVSNSLSVVSAIKDLRNKSIDNIKSLDIKLK